MSEQRDSNDTAPDSSRYAEPSEEVKHRNKVTGLVIVFLILAMIAIAMIVRAYG